MSENEHYLRRELYELVRSDEAIFEFLQAGSLDGVWYWDIESPEHEWMSRRFWELFGYDPDTKAHLAAEWQDIIDAGDLQVALGNFRDHCEDPSHPYDQYVRYRHREGHTIWVRCRGIAIRDKDGKPVRMLGAHTDVTALKEAESEVRRLAAELEARNAALESLNEELTAFSYSVSHDLRAPLRAIDGFSRLVLEDHGHKLDTEGNRLLGIVRKNTEKMATLIDDLLAFSRLSRRTVELQALDMTELARSAYEELRALEPSRSIEFRLHSLPSIVGDRALLRQVWLNLLSNALKYSRQRPKTVIEVGGKDGDVGGTPGFRRFWVRDNGVGFDPKFQDKLFGVFSRLHKQTEFEGNGVGLALVRRVVERHGGRVSASSDVGAGAVFHFELPAQQQPRHGHPAG